MPKRKSAKRGEPPPSFFDDVVMRDGLADHVWCPAILVGAGGCVNVVGSSSFALAGPTWNETVTVACLHLCVLRLGFLQHGDVGVGPFPSCQEQILRTRSHTQDLGWARYLR